MSYSKFAILVIAGIAATTASVYAQQAPDPVPASTAPATQSATNTDAGRCGSGRNCRRDRQSERRRGRGQWKIADRQAHR